MYDLYPEWGPAAHDADHPHSPQSARRAHRRWVAAPTAAPDQRDAAGERPDDN